MNSTATDTAATSHNGSATLVQPLFKVPVNSCDSHIHIYDSRFPTQEPLKRDFPVEAYRPLQKRIGTTRTVVVSPRPYVTDHQCTLDAISQLGTTVARGIAVVHPDVTDAELRRLADAGIRGIRFAIADPGVAVTTIDMVEPLARRVNDLGWHVQIHMLADQIAGHADLLQRLAAPIVFDHMGRLPPSAGLKHPGFKVIRELLDRGRTWVKLSTIPFLRDSKLAPAAYMEIAKIAQAYISAAPERIVWGSDFPHPDRKDIPDFVVLANLFAQWAPDETTRHRILVKNPEVLYGFPKSV